MDAKATHLPRASTGIAGLDVILGGGVARNRRLRELAAERLGHEARVVVPAPDLCTDNAAMIGAAALSEWHRHGAAQAPFDADPALGFA
jgi:N6-L-threonylcarbamoyladenine synthase